MIIYGYQEATLQSGTFEGAVCPHCGEQGQVAGTVFSRHAHLMWIPLFPYSRRLVIMCQHCGQESGVPNFTPEIQSQMWAFRRNQKSRIWQYTGLLLFAVFLISMIYTNRLEMANTKKFFEAPALNDVYCIEYDNEYSLMTIEEIAGDSVYFLLNDFFASKMSEIKKLHRPHFYEQEILYGYSKTELQELYDEKVIRQIWRNLPYNTEKIEIKEGDVEENPFAELSTDDDSIIEEAVTETTE